MTPRLVGPTLQIVHGLLDFVISPAGPADAAELARIHVRAWRETYPGILPQAALDQMSEAPHARRFRAELSRPREGRSTLVAEDPLGPMGYVSGGLLTGDAKAADAEVYTLYVLRTAQGAGVGRALMQGAARVLAAQGAGSMMVFVLTRNAPARRFYERLGGEAFAEVPSVGAWGSRLTETAYRWSDIRLLAA